MKTKDKTQNERFELRIDTETKDRLWLIAKAQNTTAAEWIRRKVHAERIRK